MSRNFSDISSVTRLFLGGVFVLFSITSCSSSKPEDPNAEPGAKEIKAKTKSSLDLPELELFSNARRQYQASLYSVARDSFTAIKDNYPTGPYAEFAELKIGDTQFENSDYTAAGLAYEEFAKNRPASSALPYALLRAARSYELTSSGIGRDPTPLQKSLDLYNSLIERFPNSVYVSGARYYKHGVEDLLATYEQQVIAFYDDKNKTRASDIRSHEFTKRFGTNSNEFEASEYDKKIPLAVGPISPEKMVAAKTTFKDLPSFSAQSKVVESDLPIAPAGKFLVSFVSCDSKEKLVVMTLNVKPENPPSNLEPRKQGDSIEIHLENLTTAGEETKTYSCFSEGDMTISSNGLVTLRASEATGATALFVDNPARVLLTLAAE